MKLLMMGELDDEVLRDVAGKCCVLLVTDEVDDARALAPLLYEDVHVVKRDTKPANVWLVTDGSGFYWESQDKNGSSWTPTQRKAHRFALRADARFCAKGIRVNGGDARLIRLRTSLLPSPGQETP